MPKNKQKLVESGPVSERHLRSGIHFVVKYCGSQLIEDIRKGELFNPQTVSAAIQNLLDFNRKAKRKSTQAALTLTTDGALVTRSSDGEQLVRASIERVAFCTADKRNPRVFAFVARNSVNDTVEMHACKCVNTKEPVQIAVTLNQIFSVATRERSNQEAASLACEQQPPLWCEAQAAELSNRSEWVQFS